ncbi:hypothetical protein [Flindersiella endophytica]
MSLRTALDELLRARLPGLLGGASPPVSLTVERAALTVETLPHSPADAEPRSHDGFDLLPLNAATPAGPFALTQPPALGPRRVWLQGDLGRITLRDSEVSWSDTDPKQFTLDLAGRDVTGSTHVGVRYSVIAVRTNLQAVQVVRIVLSGADAGALEGAEALVLAVLTLELTDVADASAAEYSDGDYSAIVTTEAIELTGTPAPKEAEADDPDVNDDRVVEVKARLRLDVGRALHDDEGQPIERVSTPGQPVRPGHPVDVRIDVDA